VPPTFAQFLEKLDNLREIDGEQQESKDPSDVGPLRDPPRPMIPGRPKAHPARRRPLARRMGSTNWKAGSSQSGQPKQKKVYVCRICRQQGHNAKTCRAKLKQSPSHHSSFSWYADGRKTGRNGRYRGEFSSDSLPARQYYFREL
jgi:hypothetical protein